MGWLTVVRRNVMGVVQRTWEAYLGARVLLRRPDGGCLQHIPFWTLIAALAGESVGLATMLGKIPAWFLSLYLAFEA